MSILKEVNPWNKEALMGKYDGSPFMQYATGIIPNASFISPYNNVQEDAVQSLGDVSLDFPTIDSYIGNLGSKRLLRPPFESAVSQVGNAPVIPQTPTVDSLLKDLKPLEGVETPPLKGKGDFLKSDTAGLIGALAGNVAGNIIQDGYVNDNAGIVNAAANIAQALIPNPFAKFAIGFGNGVFNRITGSKLDPKAIAKAKQDTSQAMANASALNNSTTSKGIIDNAQHLVSNRLINAGKDGPLSSKAANLSADLTGHLGHAVAIQNEGLKTGVGNVNKKQLNNVQGDFAAYGGPLGISGVNELGIALDYLNTKRQEIQAKDKFKGISPMPIGSTLFADGGTLQSHGADWTTGATHIDEGGTHEENPNQGVQVGVDPQGTPNLVEEGEIIYNDYVYSQRIELDDAAKEKFHFSKKRDITYADAAKKLEKEITERPNDPISKAAFEAQMSMLAEEQERQKQEMQAEEAREQFESLSPEEQVAVMQQMQAQEQAQAQQPSEEELAQEQAMMEQAMMEQQGMQGEAPMGIEQMAQMQGMPEQGMPPEAVQQPMMGAYGGPLFALGGNLFVRGGKTTSRGGSYGGNKVTAGGGATDYWTPNNPFTEMSEYLQDPLGYYIADNLEAVSERLAKYSGPQLDKFFATDFGQHVARIIVGIDDLLTPPELMTKQQYVQAGGRRGVFKNTIGATKPILRETVTAAKRSLRRVEQASKPTQSRIPQSASRKPGISKARAERELKNAQREKEIAERWLRGEEIPNNPYKNGTPGRGSNPWKTNEQVRMESAANAAGEAAAADVAKINSNFYSPKELGKKQSWLGRMKDTYKAIPKKAKWGVGTAMGLGVLGAGLSDNDNTAPQASVANSSAGSSSSPLRKWLNDQLALYNEWKRLQDAGANANTDTNASPQNAGNDQGNYNVPQNIQPTQNVQYPEQYPPQYQMGYPGMPQGMSVYIDPYTGQYVQLTPNGMRPIQPEAGQLSAENIPVDNYTSSYNANTIRDAILGDLKTPTWSDFTQWMKDNKIADPNFIDSRTPENFDWEEFYTNPDFLNAYQNTNPYLADVIRRGYDFGKNQPSIDDLVTFKSIDRGNWKAQDYAGWNGSEDPAWLEAVEKGYVKEGMTQEQVAEALRKTDAFQRGTKWLQNSEDNRLRYLRTILADPNTPKVAKDYAKKFINENGWLPKASRDYASIFGANGKGVRETNPGTYWHTPTEATADDNVLNLIKNSKGEWEPIIGTIPSKYKKRASYNWKTAGDGDVSYINNIANYYEDPTLAKAAAAEGAKEEAEAEEEPDKLEPILANESLRYAGALGPALGLGMWAAGIGRPDLSSLESLNKGTPTLASYHPIGNYLTYRPMDTYNAMNTLYGNARATDRAITNNAGPIGMKTMAQLANEYNTQMAQGKLYADALGYNSQNEQQVGTYNRGTDQFNAEAFNRISPANADILNRYNQFRDQLGLQIANERMSADADWYGNLYGNVQGLTKAIGDIGKDNRAYNDMALLLTSGAIPGVNPDSEWFSRWVRRKDEGGEIKTRKNKRRGGLTY